MFPLFSFLLGGFFAIMISINGNLVGATDSYTAAFLIHITGLLMAGLLLIITKRKLKFDPTAPKWIYLAGIVGILTTIFQSSSFGKISMMNITALGLLGETMTALLIDTFGFFGMKRHPFQKRTLIGFLFALAGILVMLDFSQHAALLAIAFSFGAGISIVTSRSLNSRLASSVGTMQGTFLNFACALPVTLLLALAFGGTYTTAQFTAIPWWVYLGGILGVAGVTCNNLLVPHLPAFQLTLLSFLGQLTGSTIIDLVTKTPYSSRSLIGGALIAGGMLINMILKQVFEKATPEQSDTQ